MSTQIERLGEALSDRYVIGRRLGEGGMATVYVAEDVRHDRQVALKVLRPEVSAAIGAERFLREIRVTANLQHPYVVQLYDSGEAAGVLYYVMPLVQGETLRERLDREGALPVDDAMAIARAVAQALDYAHRQGVIHRDVKPENVLLQDGVPLVSDFGIARALSRGARDRLTRTGASLGTPHYMSPEQAGGDEQVDAKSDLYSLACLIWEMLAGEPPFTGPSSWAVLARHMVDPVPRLRTLRPALPEEVERIMERALAKAPADRFATGTELVETIAGAAAATASPSLGLHRGRRRRIAAIVTGVALASVAVWSASTWYGGTGVRRLAVLPPANLGNDPQQDPVILGIHDALITELGQVGFAVIGRTSVMRYRGTATPIRDIARELGVDAVVESSVLWAADSVRIEARLVDGSTEAALWSSAYREAAHNVLVLYRDLSGTIARELRLGLSPDATTHLARGDLVDPEAYEAYLRGQLQWYELSATGFDRAFGYFRTALERSPGYAAAHSGISRVWIGRLQIGVTPPVEAASQARAAALRAIELDPALAEAHYSLALVATWADWDWERGEAEFLRALELEPNYADAHAHYAHLLFVLKRTNEGMEHMRRALDLDPYNALFRGLFGFGLLFQGRYGDAIAHSLESLDLGLDHPLARNQLAAAYTSLGRYRDAITQASAGWARGDTAIERALVRGYEEGGYTHANRLTAEILEARARTGNVAPLALATAYVAVGDHDRALAWIERGFDQRDPNMRYIGVHPNFQALWGDPRFQDLLRRMNLPADPLRTGLRESPLEDAGPAWESEESLPSTYVTVIRPAGGEFPRGPRCRRRPAADPCASIR